MCSKDRSNRCSQKKTPVICISKPYKAYEEWAYYQLKEQKANKGKRYGIEVRSEQNKKSLIWQRNSEGKSTH